jgi:hypothetical protein
VSPASGLALTDTSRNSGVWLRVTIHLESGTGGSENREVAHTIPIQPKRRLEVDLALSATLTAPGLNRDRATGGAWVLVFRSNS